MTNVHAVGYAGSSLSTALKVLPHIEAQGIDGKGFMAAVMESLHDLMPQQPTVSAGVSVNSIGSFSTPLVGQEISGAGHSRF